MSDKPSAFSCVLFDLDGTVIDTVADCTSAINRTMELFSFPTHSCDEVRSYLNNGARMLIRRAIPQEERENEALVDKVLATYVDFYRECCTVDSKVYDGVMPVLEKLYSDGAKLGIVTNKPDVQTKLMIPHYFGKLFEYFEGNSENVPVKPDARRVDMALCALCKNRSDTFFVGDSYVDVLTAKNAEIPCVGVAWGFSGVDSFSSEKPQKIVYFPDEIYDIAKNGF